MPQNGGSGPAGIHQQQQLHQLALQSYSHLSQVLPQQTQALQARFESSQKSFYQLQQELHMMQQSGQKDVLLLIQCVLIMFVFGLCC